MLYYRYTILFLSRLSILIIFYEFMAEAVRSVRCMEDSAQIETPLDSLFRNVRQTI